MATNDRDFCRVPQVARTAVDGRKCAYAFRHLNGVVGNEGLKGARANGRANDASEAQASASLRAVHANFRRRFNDFTHDSVACRGVGVQRAFLDFFRFFSRVRKITVDHVGGSYVHANVGRNLRAIRHVNDGPCANDRARASFNVLTDRQFVFHFYGVFVDGGACRFAFLVRRQRLFGLVLLRGP